MARVILVLVAVFVVAVSATLVVRSRAAPVEPEAAPPGRADLQVKELDLEEETRGVRWRLRAEQALTFDRAGQTELRKLVARIHERDRSWTIVADEGRVDRKTENVEVRHNVVVTSDDGLRLETSVLRWEARQKRLWTEAPVRLSRAGSVVHGSGLDVRMEDEATTIRGPVRAVFVPGRSR